jgi:hypothetical protein
MGKFIISYKITKNSMVTGFLITVSYTPDDLEEYLKSIQENIFVEVRYGNLKVLIIPNNIIVQKTKSLHKAQQGVIISFEKGFYTYIEKNPFDDNFDDNKEKYNSKYLDPKNLKWI